MQIDKNLYEEINEYCKLNNLKTRDFIHKLLKDSFLKEKYGESPFFLKKESKNEVEEIEKDISSIKIEYNNDEIISVTTENVIDFNSKEDLETQSVIPITKIKKTRKLK